MHVCGRDAPFPIKLFESVRNGKYHLSLFQYPPYNERIFGGVHFIRERAAKKTQKKER